MNKRKSTVADNLDITHLRLDFNVVDTYNGSSRFQPDVQGRRPFNFEEDMNSTFHEPNEKDKGVVYHIFRDSIASKDKLDKIENIVAQETVITTDDQEL